MRTPFNACPLCTSASFSFVCTADISRHPLWRSELPRSITWVRCEKCAHVFTVDYWTDEALKLIFSKTLPHQAVGADYERQRPIAARMIERVMPHLSDRVPMPQAWLDVGAGNGALLFTAQEYGFACCAIDMREDVIASLQARGIQADVKDITDCEDPISPFGVISFADCLEHISHPGEALKNARLMLVPNGTLFVSCPNTDTELWRAWDRTGTNPYWGELEHYHNFTRARFFDLLNETGFTPISYGVSERYRCGMEVIARAI